MILSFKVSSEQVHKKLGSFERSRTFLLIVIVVSEDISRRELSKVVNFKEYTTRDKQCKLWNIRSNSYLGETMIGGIVKTSSGELCLHQRSMTITH